MKGEIIIEDSSRAMKGSHFHRDDDREKHGEPKANVSQK